MNVRTDKQEPQMKAELKPLEDTSQKAETKPRDSNKVILCGILCLSLCANVGSSAAFFASKETCVTGVPLLKEGQEVPLKTTERRRLGADYCYSTVCTRHPVLKKCAVVPSGTEPCWELVHPAMTDIPDNFLRDNTDLTGTLKLGAAVKTIGEDAFYKTKLTGLDLSNAALLVSIGNGAFAYTDITGTLVIPAKVETIGMGAFYDTDITGLDLSAVKSIGTNAFWGTDITGTLVIPANVETIGEGAFYQTKLTGLDISDAASLVSIDSKAFLRTRITGTIESPFNVPTYAANSFPAGVSIITIPPSPSPPPFPGLKECTVAPSGTEPCWELADPTMTDIPRNFLTGNTDLTGTLKLGAAVKTIGKQAFASTKLTGLDLSGATSLESIGEEAFIYSTDITGTLVIPGNVTTIGRESFYQTKLTGLDLSNAASLVLIGDSAFVYTEITGLDLSNATSLVSIGEEAFIYIDITGTLVIPGNVTTIGESAFYGTTLTSLDLSNAASLVSISDYAFYRTEITGTLMIPAKVETIGQSAFYQTELTGLDLSHAASLESIGGAAFSGTFIMGTIVTPFNVPTYTMGGREASFREDESVTIVKG